MNTITQRFLLLFSLFFLGAPLAAQGIDELVGTWVGTSEDVQGEKATITKDSMTVDGDTVPLRWVSPGVVVLGPAGEQARMTYKIDGDVMTVTLMGETSKWRRAGAAPAPKSEQPRTGNPLGGTEEPAPHNPLGGPEPKPVDPFVRRFDGDNIALQLDAGPAGQYRGTLTFQGKPYPVEAKAEGQMLRGAFRVGEHSFEFSAELRGDRLTLQSGGKRYLLTGEKLAPKLPVNPLGGDETPHDQGKLGDAGPPAGMRKLVHAEGDLACYLPRAWSVMQQNAQMLLVNPGFEQGQRLMATLSLHCLALPEESQKMTLEKFVESEIPGFRQSLAANGVTTSEQKGPMDLFDVQGMPAAAVTFDAQTRDGTKGIVWLALRIENGKCLMCSAIMLGETQRTHASVIRDVYASLRPAARAGELREEQKGGGTEDREVEVPGYGK